MDLLLRIYGHEFGPHRHLRLTVQPQAILGFGAVPSNLLIYATDFFFGAKGASFRRREWRRFVRTRITTGINQNQELVK